MRGGDGAVADPHAHRRRIAIEHRIIELQAVLFLEARKEQIDVGGADVEGRRVLVIQVRFNAPQKLRQLHPPGFEIETRYVFVVEEASADLGRSGKADHRAAAVERCKIVDRRSGGLGASACDFPVFDDAFQNCGLLRFQELRERNALGIEPLNHPSFALNLRHRRARACRS